MPRGQQPSAEGGSAGQLPADRARAAFADAVATRVLHRDPAASPMRRGVAALVAVLLVLVVVAVAGFLVEYLRSGEGTARAAGAPGATAPTTGPDGSTGSDGSAGPDGSAVPGTTVGPAGTAGPGGPVPAGPAPGTQTGAQLVQPPPAGPQAATTPAVAAATRTTAPATSGRDTTTAPQATSAARPAAATYAAIAGPGCSGNNDARNWYTWGVYRDGTAGWYDISGGHRGDGCSGAAMAMPMSGGSTATGRNYVVWWFETAPVVNGTCAFSVHVPNSGSARDVAGNPAVYKVLGGRTSTTPYAQFSINQTANRGRWVGSGSVAVRNGAISLHLQDSGADPGGEHIGVAQVRVNCTAG
ncbi:hypothetical protein O7623_18880 [Solwaraspora sp. WMMD791]|uniref:hypothetical protein n=1 Tax=Solwaraspora sp. WMMD791 TaxID=3016086 RepID=UPI00249CC7D9|nr:hypothetical protein [Solwaraspora sp. WMMD791]WFE25451.1 hypothetical protein O7623_18880 [Solwaraspora sp. WMMD791]